MFLRAKVWPGGAKPGAVASCPDECREHFESAQVLLHFVPMRGAGAF